MLNSTKTARKRRYSTFLAQKKEGFRFVRENHGTINAQKMPAGTYQVKFSSRATGRTAHAYGATFRRSYFAMIRMFNLKYPA